MPSLLDRVADFLDPLIERAQKYLVRDPETGKMVTPEELEFQTAVRAEMRRQQAEKERLKASRLGPAGRTFEQVTGTDAEMDWYREQARQREAAQAGRDIFRGVSGMAQGIAQAGGAIGDLSSQVAPMVESAREADRVALEEGRPASQERLLELQLRHEAGGLETASPEWQELAGLVRQGRRETQLGAQQRQFDAFVQAIQEKQPDLDLAGAARIARARLEASGGDLSKALGTFEEAYRNLYERSDPFLTAALPIAAGAPLVGGGLAANLLGRGSLGLGRYLASSVAAEAGGYAGAAGAREIGAPPIAGALLGGLTGGVAGAIAPTPGQVGRTAARRISEAAPGIAAAADVPGIVPRLTSPTPQVAGRPRKPAPAASVVPESALPSPSAARGASTAEVAAGQAQPPAGAVPPAGTGGTGPPSVPPGGRIKPPPDPARALDGVIPGESVPDAAFRQYEGGIETAARIERLNLGEGVQKLRQAGVSPGTKTPEVEALYKALHGEGQAPEGLAGVFDDLKTLLAQEEAMTLDFDPKFQLHPDYFPRFWQEPKVTRPGPAGLGGKPAFVKARVDATFSELLDAGYKPRTWNPYEMVSLRRMAGAEYREQGRLLGILKGEGLVSDVVGPLPDGWRIPDVTGAVFQPKPYVDAGGAIRFTPPKMVPNGVANVLEQMFGRKLSWGTVGPVDVHGVVSSTFNAAKRTKLLGSFFQQADFANRTGFSSMGAALNDLAHGKPVSAVKNTVRLPKSIGELIGANLSPTWRQNLKRTLTSNVPVVKERPGLTWNLISKQGLSTGDVSAFNKTMRDSLLEASKDATAGRARGVVNRINGAMERGLFEGVYPQAQKNAVQNFIAPALVRAHPEWTDAQLAASIAVEANKMFSSLPRSQSALRHINRNLTEVARMAIFSTNETESFLKATGSTFIGPNRQLWAQYWAGGVVFLAATAEVMHYAVTGEPLPHDRLSPVKPGGPLGVQYNTRWLAPDIAEGLGRGGTNLSLDLLMQMDTSLRLLDPKSFVEARENVIPRAVFNQARGKDFFDRPLDSAKKRIGQFASDVAAPIPAQHLSGLLLKRFPALEGWIADNEARLGPYAQAAQGTGLNFRAETNAMVRDRMAAESGLKDKNGKPIENWREATPAQKKEIESRPQNQALIEELKRRGEEAAQAGSTYAQYKIIDEEERASAVRRAQAVEREMASGGMSGGDARRSFDAIEEELALAAEARRKTPEMDSILKELAKRDNLSGAEKATQDYFAMFDDPAIRTATGAFNFDRYKELLTQWETDHPGYTKEDVSPGKPLTAKHEELEKDRKTLEPYWENERQVWERIAPTLPPGLKADEAKSMDDLKKLLIQRAVSNGSSANKAQEAVDELWAQPLQNGLSLAEMERISRSVYLAQHQELVPLLLKWNYHGWTSPPKYLVEEIEKRQKVGAR